MAKKITRRDFLKKSAISLAAISLPNIAIPGAAFAAQNPKALVVVQLTGGLDPLLAFPYTSDISNFRAPGSRIEPGNVSTVIAPGMGVHPGFNQLSPYLGNMKVIMQTGNAFLSNYALSHEEAQLAMVTGGYGDISKRVGWTARMFDNGIDLRGFGGLTPSFNCETCSLPPIVTTTYEDLGINDQSMWPGHNGVDNAKYVTEVLATLSGYKPSADDKSDPIGLNPTRNIPEVEKYYRKSQRGMFHAVDKILGRHGITGTLSDVNKTPKYDNYTTINPPIDVAGWGFDFKTLGNQFRNMAQTLKEMQIKGDSSKIIFVLEIDGFDLHGGWIPNGNNLMWSIGTALKVFLDDMVAIGMYNDLAMFFCTEFGRTIKTGGDGGTDHGVGYSSFVLGGKVNGGVYGHIYTPSELFSMTQNNVYAWPRETAQERIIAELLQNHLKVDPALAFPGDFLGKIPPAPGLNLFKA
jgi:hypothetical protein